MSFQIMALADDSFPEGSPLRDVEITVEQETAWDPPEYYPSHVWVDDPEWTYVDSNGHEHFRDGDEFPTLRDVYEEHVPCGPCCGDYEEYDYLSHRECIGCGEKMYRSGKKPELYTPTIPVRTEITLERRVYNNEPEDLMGIEPVEWIMNAEYKELTYRPTWKQWMMLVEENNRIVTERGD